MELTDPTAIRALAHPLRLDLLELLGAIGSATAARCGRVLGVPQANCSFHLRQLAKYGLVEDAGPGRDRREREWRVSHGRLRLPDNDAATRQVAAVYLRRAVEEMLDYVGRAETEDPDWASKGGLVGGLALVSADEHAEITKQLRAVLEPYLDRAVGDAPRPEPGQRYVRYLLAGTPLPPIEDKDGEDDNASD